MRATEICGEVFCETWAVFLTVWLVVRNATLHHSECHTSTRQTPHFANVQVWHLPYSSAAFALSKCGIPDSEVWYLFTPSPSFFLTTTSFFSLLFLSYLLLRARGQVFIVSICIIAHYDVFFLSDFFFKFSNCFAIVLHFTESFH